MQSGLRGEEIKERRSGEVNGDNSKHQERNTPEIPDTTPFVVKKGRSSRLEHVRARPLFEARPRSTHETGERIRMQHWGKAAAKR